MIFEEQKTKEDVKKKSPAVALAATVLASLIFFIVFRELHSVPVAELILVLFSGIAVVSFARKKIIKAEQAAEKAIKEAQAAVTRAELQIQVSNRSRMEFLGNMSHELRTPLNAVIGFSEILKNEVMGPLGSDTYKHYAQDIYDSGHRLLEVISEILEVSRLETGSREITSSNFKLSRAVVACLTIMSSRIEQSGVKLDVLIPEDLPEILGEELSIKQILLNLLGNALKFTPKGGKVHIKGYIDTATGEMVIDVVDSGIGMTAEELKRVLQPFGRADGSLSSSNSGTGLGLTIVSSLARLHGGKFELYSEKGAGTTARVRLPKERVIRK